MTTTSLARMAGVDFPKAPGDQLVTCEHQAGEVRSVSGCWIVKKGGTREILENLPELYGVGISRSSVALCARTCRKPSCVEFARRLHGPVSDLHGSGTQIHERLKERWQRGSRPTANAAVQRCARCPVMSAYAICSSEYLERFIVLVSSGACCRALKDLRSHSSPVLN